MQPRKSAWPVCSLGFARDGGCPGKLVLGDNDNGGANIVGVYDTESLNQCDAAPRVRGIPVGFYYAPMDLHELRGCPDRGCPGLLV